MSEEKKVYYEYLSFHNIKQSKQREMVLDIFLSYEGHLTTQELYDLVRLKDKEIGVATVYRAMKVICDSGLASEIDVGDGNKRYEHKYNHPHHDHLICTKCGKLIEFNNPKIEQIQMDVCKEMDFQPCEHRLQIYGICKKCRE